MNYEEFKLHVRRELQNMLGEEVKVYSILKNNSMALDAICVNNRTPGMAVPTIYIEPYYHEYMKGTHISEIVHEMYSFYLEHRRELAVEGSYFEEYEHFRDKIVYKLINRKMNGELLNRIPHEPYLDLEIVYYVLLASDSIGEASMLIEYDHLKMWGITQEQLKEDAQRNTPMLLPGIIRPMEQMMRDMGIDLFEEEDEIDEGDDDGMLFGYRKEEEDKVPLYVISNDKNYCGAGCILYPKMMERFADLMDDDVVLIPSSIHEMILIPRILAGDRDNLNAMVREVNEDHVAEDEILSDHVYLYDRTDEIVIDY